MVVPRRPQPKRKSLLFLRNVVAGALLLVVVGYVAVMVSFSSSPSVNHPDLNGPGNLRAVSTEAGEFGKGG